MFTNQLPQNDPSTPNYTLSCADAALAAKKVQLDCAFKKEVQKQYLATVANVDFSKAEEVDLKINYFVAEQTRGKIRHIVNGVSPNTSALAVNAVYLKGKWETPFPSELSKSQPFYSPLGEQSVPFMHVSGPFPYTETNDYQAIFLPYVGQNVGLILFLPRQKNGLSTLEKTMTPDMIVKVVNQLKTASAVVYIPKIGIQYFRNFTNDFKSLGATCAYDGSGDFSGISKNKHLAVSGPLHKAYLEIDEGNQDEGN
ncbi:serpin B6-like [Parasteatoda tepidariorum]|uniref:serpin B6-like n=1 Tax=Parasteatoda tepidariorum TaxID=114398 RepID=UPI001C71FACD|nr:serpin B6-like [Parasteatoda tepidariorum]